MTEKKKKNRDTLGTMQIHSMKQYWKVGRGLFQSFLFFFLILHLPSFLINATAFTSTRRHRQQPPYPQSKTNKRQTLAVVRLTVAVEARPWDDLVEMGLRLSQLFKPVWVALFAKWPKSWLPWATVLKVVVAPNRNIHSDLLGGIHVSECKLDFRLNLLCELMRTGFSKC